MSRIIESRDGVEVYPTDAGFVCLKQATMGDESIILVHPDDVDRLIGYLKETRAEAYEIRKNPPESRDA